MSADAQLPNTACDRDNTNALSPLQPAQASMIFAGWLAVTLALCAGRAGAQTLEQVAIEQADQVGKAQQAENSPRELRLLVLPRRRTPSPLLRTLTQLLGELAQVVLARDYAREARGRGLAPESAEALEQLLPKQKADLLIVAGAGRNFGQNVLELVYREGQAGLEVFRSQHMLAGNDIDDDLAWRIVSEARLVLNAVLESRRPQEEASAKADEGRPKPRPLVGRAPETSKQVARPSMHVGLTLGFGVGSRSFELPTELSIVRLDTGLFSALALRLGLDYQREVRRPHHLLTGLRYITSLGLKTQDQRADGTFATTPSRSQRLDATVGYGYRSPTRAYAPGVSVASGWGIRLFTSEAALTLPNTYLTGPFLRMGVELPLYKRRLLVYASPELSWLVAIDNSVTAQGVAPMAWSLGGDAGLRWWLTTAFFLEAAYREAHAILSAREFNPSDVERYFTLRIGYRP